MKRALVISGGGSKGAFAVGVLKELFQRYPGLDFDIYVGTSTGTLVTAMAAVRKMDELEYLYTHLTTNDLLIKGNIVDKLSDTSIFDVSPLWNQIKTHYTDADYETLLSSSKQMFINTVCLQTNELTIFSNDPLPAGQSGYKMVQTINANHFRRAVLASCCQPVFMQPIEVGRDVPGAENPHYQYVDGGVLEYIGIQSAIDAGATHIVAILLSSLEQKASNPIFTNLMDILGETIDILVSDVGDCDLKLVEQQNASWQYVASAKKKMLEAGIPEEKINGFFDDPNVQFMCKEPVQLIKIRPTSSLGGGPGGLEFRPAEMKNMLAAGRLVFNDVAMEVDFDSFLTA